MNETNRIYLYDTTLRDGAQTAGVDFSVADKQAIAAELDALGLDYVEGGWPGANPTDDAFFQKAPTLRRARLTAFGMTRRPGRSADNDPGLAALLDSGAGAVCLVGKTWDFHVDVALGVTREENLQLIGDSVAAIVARGREALFDAEHFFDGFKANPDYALTCLERALVSGARWIVLCDTNGGTLPDEVERIVAHAARRMPGERLGIHAHNDTDNAVANSLAAVRAGARMVQGTLNGLGERCGNANLLSILPSLSLKMGYSVQAAQGDGLRRLTHISRALDERLNRTPNRHAPYVGESAFAHKGGLHVSAVEKNPACYEHINPALVGNHRHVLVSDQAGRSNVLARLREAGVTIAPDNPQIGQIVELVKQREFEGYAYDGAEASFELLARRVLGETPDYFRLASFRVLDERRWNAKGELVTLSEATAKLEVTPPGSAPVKAMTVAEGSGPIDALDQALRKALTPIYPALAHLRLVDYKVRILNAQAGAKAVTRVIIESADDRGGRWSTVGVSANVIDASFNALYDSIAYCLYRSGVGAAAA
jgi:2-isopropylmalate synthase